MTEQNMKTNLTLSLSNIDINQVDEDTISKFSKKELIDYLKGISDCNKNFSLNFYKDFYKYKYISNNFFKKDQEKLNDEDKEFIKVLALQADKNGDTILHCAASFRDENLASKLIDAGAVVDAKNKSGYTPLVYAGMNGHNDMVKFLISKGADVNMLYHTQACITCCIITIFQIIPASIIATTLFATGTIAPTALNITCAASIIALSSLLICCLTYREVFKGLSDLGAKSYSTPGTELKNSQTAESVSEAQGVSQGVSA